MKQRESAPPPLTDFLGPDGVDPDLLPKILYEMVPS